MTNYLDSYACQPWFGWLLVCLCRQQARQDWLWQVHKERLLPIRAEQGEEGTVPGLANWSYCYHGRGLLLEGPNSEALDVDFYDDSARTIDPYFFAHRVLGLSLADGPEVELRRWLPSAGLIVASIAELHDGPLQSEEGHVFQLGEELSHVAATSIEVESLRLPKIESLGSELHAKFEDWLEELLAQSQGLVADVMCHFPRDKQTRIVQQMLCGEISPQMGQTIKAAHLGNIEATTAILRVAAQLDATKHHPHVAWQICRYLLTRDIEVERAIAILQRFSEQRVVTGYLGNPFADELALLCLTYAPSVGIVLLRRALRSSTPACIRTLAAWLASVDEPWSRIELVNALSGATPQSEMTNCRFLAAALQTSEDELTRARGRKLMPPVPVRSPGQFGCSYDEVVVAELSRRDLAQSLQTLTDLTKLPLQEIAECAANVYRSSEGGGRL